MSKIFILLLAAVSHCTPSHSEIFEAAKISDVKNLFYQDELWVLVDLDNCLFESKQALGHVLWYYDLLEEKLRCGMSQEEAIAEVYPEWVKTQAVCPIKPLESDFVDLLISLQNQGVVVMGLTHRLPSVAKASICQVKTLGIDFSKTAVWHGEFSPEAAFPTLFSNGIIFVNDNNNKGDVLASFLSHIQQKPEKVLFIDDKRANVEEVGNVLNALEVEYTGIHYTAFQKSPPVYFRKLADFQYQFLDRILSNEEATLLINQQ